MFKALNQSDCLLLRKQEKVMAKRRNSGDSYESFDRSRIRHYDDYDDYDTDSDDYDDDYDSEYDSYDDEYDDYEDDSYRGHYEDEEEDVSYSSPKKMSKKSVKKQKRKKIIQFWFILIVFIAVAAVSYLEISKRIYRGEPLELGIVGSDMHLNADWSIGEVVQDNHERYMKKAYVLVEGQYLKISANVARNNFDFENGFTAPDGRYMKYTGDGEAKGSTAIDVSSHNAGIDWGSVKASGVEGAMIRLGYRGYGSEATLTTDKNFTSNINGAKAAGLKVGVYFFTQALTYEEGVEEAKYVLEQIQGMDIEMPIAIDTENVDADPSARANNIDKGARTDAVVGFCETIKEAGYTPMIYSNRNWFLSQLDIDRIGDYQFWLANYSFVDFPYHIEGFQYTPEGNVPGVSGNCDVNIWF